MANGLGRIPHPETPQARAAYPVTARPDYQTSLRTCTYWNESGAWLDQGNTGTCVGNAFAHRYADGPVNHAGIDEAWARQLYVDASGDTSLQEGTSALAACRVLKTRGEITSYHWVTSASELRNTILELGSVCVGINWYSSMDGPYQLHNGRAYFTVDTNSDLRGGHEILVNGINTVPQDGPPFYRIKNSWGRTWPGTKLGPGTARFALGDLEQLVFQEDGDAVLIQEV